MADKLDEQQLKLALTSLPAWSHSGNALTRSFEFHDFKTALYFVNRVGDTAEAMGHHPDIDIRYNRVKLSLSSHDAGGITSRDVTLAGKIDALH